MNKNDWAKENKCHTDPAYKNNDYMCWCVDETICEDINGVKNNCPCPEGNNKSYYKILEEEEKWWLKGWVIFLFVLGGLLILGLIIWLIIKFTKPLPQQPQNKPTKPLPQQQQNKYIPKFLYSLSKMKWVPNLNYNKNN